MGREQYTGRGLQFTAGSLHVHSLHSDGKSRIDEIDNHVRKFEKKYNNGKPWIIVGYADHDTNEGHYAAQDIYARTGRPYVRMMETAVSFGGAFRRRVHIMTYLSVLPQEPLKLKKELSLQEYVEWFRWYDPDGFLGIPHVAQATVKHMAAAASGLTTQLNDAEALGILTGNYRDIFRVVEVAYRHNDRGAINLRQRLIEELYRRVSYGRISMVGGEDAHHLNSMFWCLTDFRHPVSSPEDAHRALRDGGAVYRSPNYEESQVAVT